MKDVSLVIAHRGPTMGLWMTLESSLMALRDSGLDYEFIVVANGEPEKGEDFERQAHWLKWNGHKLLRIDEALSPPSARQRGTDIAAGKNLFFLDNHCMVEKNYFTRALETMAAFDVEMVHSTTRFWMGEGSVYEYRMNLERKFWVYKSHMTPVHKERPYQIAVAGHGGFAVTRRLWDEVGGYWDGFVGYAGEEPYFDFKVGLMGHKNFIDPQMIHYHWSGVRNYNRHNTDDFFRNLLKAANIIGGEQRMYRVFDAFKTATRVAPPAGSPHVPIFDILEQAYYRSRERAAWLRSKELIGFEELLEQFKRNGIRY
jgi:hypothetical protein